MAERILGIETSCDETSAAVIERAGPRFELKSLVILSQDVHRVFGGVVPELASRQHLKVIDPVVRSALEQAETRLDTVSAIAVTAGPGLIGALLVGVMYAKGLAQASGIPLVGVHHHEGHLFAPLFDDPDFGPPTIALLVSGGHTMLLDVPAWGEYRLLGQTIDDAAGEAFDKVATMLGLPYPGGAALERLAATGSPDRFRFPRPLLKHLHQPHQHQYGFSFSGLKTALLYACRDSADIAADRADLARGFQDAIVEVLVEKTAHAVIATGRPRATIVGGVACNRTLAEQLRRRLNGIATVTVATPRLNTDNAAMIAAAGAWHLGRGEQDDGTLEPFDWRPMPGLTEFAPLGDSGPAR